MKINIIYHHVAGETRESHPSVQDLQSTTRLVESWMLQILDTRMGFTEYLPQRSDWLFFPTCKMHISNEKPINNVHFYPLLARLASMSYGVIKVYVMS